jgi:hypothetical protein
MKFASSLSWLHEPPPRQLDPVHTLTTLTLILTSHVPLSLPSKMLHSFDPATCHTRVGCPANKEQQHISPAISATHPTGRGASGRWVQQRRNCCNNLGASALTARIAGIRGDPPAYTEHNYGFSGHCPSFRCFNSKQCLGDWALSPSSGKKPSPFDPTDRVSSHLRTPEPTKDKIHTNRRQHKPSAGVKTTILNATSMRPSTYGHA